MTLEQYKEKRGRKIFIDYARNSYGLNARAPYSVRDKEYAPVATPIYWEELGDTNLHSQTYNIKNIFRRLETIQDPWDLIHKHSFSLSSAQERLSRIRKEV